MARQFDGINDSLISAASVDLSGQSIITVSFWLYWDAFANDDDLAMELTANAAVNNDGFFIDPNASGGAVELMIGDASAHLKDGTFPRSGVSAAAWHNWIVEFDRTAANGVLGIKVWIDNVAQTMTPVITVALTGNFANSTLNLMCRNNTSLFAAGRLFEYAIYSGTITAGNRASLQTDSPSLVGSPIFHWGICGTASPEPASSGGVNLTVNGAVFVANPLTLTGSPCNPQSTFILIPGR